MEEQQYSSPIPNLGYII